MRIGAIFARGSCRALKWMALFGVLFALGAGSAVAQITIKGPTDDMVAEGDEAVYPVTVKGFVAPDASADEVTVTVVLTPAEGDGATQGEVSDYTTNLGLTFSVDVPAGPASGDGVVGRAFNASGAIRIPTQDDNDAEDERFTLAWTVDVGGLNTTNAATGGTPIAEADGSPTVLTIDDDEEQTYVLKLMPATQKPNEGDMVTVSLTAEPEHTTPNGGSTQLALHLDQTPPFSFAIEQNSAAVTGNLVTIGGEAADSSATVTITTNPNDKNRVDDTITLTAFSGTAGDSEAEATLEVKLTDNNKLPAITAKAIALDEDGDALEDQPDTVSVMEGGMIDIELTVRDEDGDSIEAAEDLEVSLMPTGSADAQDYRLAMHPVEIEMGDKTATVRLTANLDQDIGMETLMFDATVAGDDANGEETSMVMGILSVDIMDTTMKLVEAKSDEEIQAIIYAAKDEGEGADEMLNPGEMVMVDASMLFTAAEGVSVVYTASSDMMDVAGVSTSGSMVTVTAGEPGGPAHVTITATAQPPSGAMALTQTSPNVAQVIFPVDVALSALTVAVTADPMEIMEGGMSTITATASREIAMSDGEVKVDLEVVGDGELSASSITIMAGEMMGTATVMAMEDDDDYEDETLTVIARGAGTATLTIMVTDNDTAPEPPAPTNLVTAKSDAEIQMVLEAAGLGDDDMFNPGAMAMVDASMLFDAAEGVSVSYAAESDDMAAVTTSVSGGMVSVMAGEAGHAHVTITATATMASGIEIYSGQPATNVATVLFSVNVTNMPLAITVSTDPMDMVEEGGTIMVTATANRDVVAADGDVEVMLTITGAVEMNEMMIAIAAGSSNSAMVQVLDDNEVAPLADITIVATGSGIATAQTFTIAVTENDSPRTFTLSAPEDMMNLVEGGDGVELTVTADPAVSMDTEVMIMVDRAASTAGADDFTAEPVMIMAGETSGTTMLMAVEDMMDDSGHASPEMLVVFAMADNTQSNTVSFYIWDMAVPALPIIAQLLLAFFLAIGGYRRYLRR